MLNSIRLENMTCTLGKQELLTGASIEINRGEMLFIVGESGAGKTILSNLVMGYALTNAQVDGQIYIDDKESTLADLAKMRGRELCYVPQPTTSLDPLQKYDSRYPFQMSGGMQKLALVDYCLNKDAEIFVIDEPTTGLDDSKANLVMEWFLELKNNGAGLLIVSHDMNLAFKYADRIVFFKDGKVFNSEAYKQEVIDAMPKNAEFEKLVGTTCLFGDTGSGKTTFAKTLVKQGVQLVYQNPYSSFNPKLSIRTSLADAGEINARLLKSFKLGEELLDRKPNELSGGELQRFSIIRALMMHPQTLIMDESTSMLDTVTQKMIFDFVLDYCGKNNVKLIFITHDVDLRDKIASKTVTFHSPFNF